MDVVSFALSFLSFYVATVATILPVLVKHESRLTRLESKIDTIIRLMNGDKGG